MKVLARIAAGVLLAALVGCGGGGGGGAGDGGGGGGAGPVQFSGNTNPAIINTSNSGALSADATNSQGGSELAAAFSGVSPVSQPKAGQGLIDIGRRVSRSMRGIVAKPRAGSPATSVAVDETQPCSEGGSVQISGDLTPNGTGTVKLNFSNCEEGGDVFTGTATMRIDAAVITPDDVIFTDFTISFGRLAVRGSVNADIGGSVHVLVDAPANKETTTENLVALYINEGRMTKSENLVSEDTYDNLSNPTSFTEVVNGRVFSSAHGFVDIVTTVPLRFPTLTQLFPSGGELVLSASNRSIRVTANSATRVTLGLDLDGDGVFERQVRLAWTDLDGPIGANLADTDGDGMHDGWEIAFGRDPNVKDAANDPDNDGFSNLAEYLGGGNPNDPASKPALVVGTVLPAASDIAFAAIDRLVPDRSGIASNGTNFLLVSCRQLPSPGVFGALISESGRVLLSNIVISSDPCPQRTAVASDGRNYLVVVSREGQLFGIRVSASGTVLNAAGDVIASNLDGTDNASPSVAFDGTNYLVVWRKVNGAVSRTIHAATVNAAGVVLRTFPITTALLGVPGFPGTDSRPTLAFGGGKYLVAWSALPIDEDLRASFVSGDGTVSPAFPIATLPESQLASGVAFDGTNYLVVWDHVVESSSVPLLDGQIFGRRVTPDGALLDGPANSPGIAISAGSFASLGASVAFTGSTFLVTWAVNPFTSLQPNGIFATRVSKDGVRIDGSPADVGISLSGSAGFASSFTDPVVALKRESGLIAWINNSQAFDPKDILAVPVISP